jgi:hypothetical protein
MNANRISQFQDSMVASNNANISVSSKKSMASPIARIERFTIDTVQNEYQEYTMQVQEMNEDSIWEEINKRKADLKLGNSH